MTGKKFVELIKRTFSQWVNDKVTKHAAALSYYTTFSLVPLLIISIGIASFVVDAADVQTYTINYIQSLMGESSALQIKDMLHRAGEHHSGLIETIIGLIILLLAASGFFGELQDSMNTIWGVEPKPNRGIRGIIKDRFFSFTLVLGVGFLLLVSLLFSLFLSTFSDYINRYLPGGATLVFMNDFLVSLAGITLVFALIFKIIPDVVLGWKDVILGAVVTALLFILGKFALTIYLGRTNFNSSFGATASLVIILVWVYYSVQLLFLGCEFTKVYVTFVEKKKIKPKRGSILIDNS